MFGALVLAFFVGTVGCTTPPQSAPLPEATSDMRTEMMLLNVQEESAWVAYGSRTNTNMTEYVVRILHPDTGRIVYESTILMPVGLAAHGFELSPDDPLLKATRQFVDSRVLPDLPPDSDEEETSTSQPAGKLALSDATLIILHVDKDGIVFDHGGAELKVGQRMFLRSAPTILRDPVDNRPVLITKGAIAGIVEVSEVREKDATAKLVSGSFPEDAHLEPIE